MYHHTIAYQFIYDKYFVQVQFGVLNEIGESNASVDKKFKEYKLLFYQMFNSIVIDNVWEIK